MSTVTQIMGEQISMQQFTWATKFCTMVNNIFAPQAWNLINVTILAPGIFKSLREFG
jgi:hypothetical protein